MNGDLEKLHASPRDVALWRRAQQQVLENRHRPALETYRDLANRFPGVAQLWFELGIAAAGELDFALADDAFRRTRDLAPDDATMLILLGQQYQRLRRLDRVRDCFERAAAADPASLEAQLSLAAWCEKDRRLDDAWNAVEAALARHPGDARALNLRAFLFHRWGRNADAEKILRDVAQRGSADPAVRSETCHWLAVVLDELGQYDEALRWLLEAKTHARKLGDVAKMEKDYDRSAFRRRELLAQLTPEMIRRWRAEAPVAPYPQQLALLGGHPRSGTTLLEQILGAHPEVRAFDEPEAFLNEVWNPLEPVGAARGLSLKELDALSPARRADIRRRHLQSLLREDVPAGARVLLVKNPSPTLALPLWLRIFPELKVLIALRDPRDVVVSCFFQNLSLTVANANFLSLDRTVKHYTELMDVWLRLRELGGFDWIEVEYHDVVENLEVAGRRATEFLGLSWDAGQAKFHETARKKFLFAPTYADVTQPLHQRRVGRWQHYAAALAPFQERLAPYLRALGYER